VYIIGGILLVLVAGFAFGQMMGQGNRGYGNYGGYGGMMGWWNSPPPEGTKALTIDQVAESVQNYIKDFWGPDLKLAEVWEFDNQFYAEAREKSTGIGAIELLINKWTGAIVPDGHMGAGMMGGGMMGGPRWGWGGREGYRGWQDPTKEMTVTPQEARQYAQEFLDARLPGTKVEKDADTFYGYYTITVLKDGKVYGMLGVNGYTGWVWYHEWHGKFIQMKEF
jgi:hypothetical protein